MMRRARWLSTLIALGIGCLGGPANATTSELLVERLTPNYLAAVFPGADRVTETPGRPAARRHLATARLSVTSCPWATW
jgi:transcriptional regulator of nitric oxide reductase